MLPHNSKSLLLMTPVQLFEETSLVCTDFEKSFLHRLGTTVTISVGINATPPIPGPAASQATRRARLLGTSSAICAGWDATLLANQQKSSKTHELLLLIEFAIGQTPHDKRLLVTKKVKPGATGMAMDIDQNSPKILSLFDGNGFYIRGDGSKGDI